MLKTYLEISLGMTAVIALILILTPLLKKRYKAGLRYAVWIICALALIIPYRPSPKVMIELPKRELEQNYRSESVSVNTESIPAEIPAAENSAVVDTVAAADAGETSYTEPESEKVPVREVNVGLILTLIWLLGAAAFMLYYIVGYGVFAKKIKPWCRRIKVEGYTGKPRLLYCKIVKSPMLIGFFRPRILLPRIDYGKDEIAMILKHELTHYKRGDLWAKLLLTAANALHWFNPAVYAMRRYANRDMEYSCDELVVKNSDREFREAYSLTILHCAARGAGTAFSTYFSEDKKNLKQRFKNILSGKKKRGIIICALLAVTAVVCAGVFGFGKAFDEEENYLFLGVDGRNHIDTVMLARVSGNGIAVTSIPRNTMVLENYTGCFLPNMAQDILRTIPYLTGAKVNKYIVADTDDALVLLSELGGVKFEIPDLYGDGEGMVYDDPYQDLHISLNPGEHNLTGEEMLQVMRYRKSNVKSDGYNSYDEGDLDRIKMTHALLEQIVKQKKDIMMSDEVYDAARAALRSTVTNIGGDDILRILKAARGNVTFELLKGGYSRDIGNRNVFYGPDILYEPYSVLRPDYRQETPIVYAYDTTELHCRALSLTIDGEEQAIEPEGEWCIWYNERKGKLHTCIEVKLADGTSIVIQAFENFALDGNSASGVARWSRQIRKFEAAESVLSEEYIDATITGLDTETPVFRSDDGRYEVKLEVTKRDEGNKK